MGYDLSSVSGRKARLVLLHWKVLFLSLGRTGGWGQGADHL